MDIEDFVTVEQSLALKKLGFRENCLYFYADNKLLPVSICIDADDDELLLNGEISVSVDTLLYQHQSKCNDVHDGILESVLCDAPTLTQAQKWLRKKKKLSIEPFSSLKKGKYTFEIINVDTWYEYNSSKTLSYHFDSYEEALSAGITECIKLLENNL